MLKIKDIQIRNFRSYGDYDTIVQIAGLGPTLILGDKEKQGELRTSNGAGKTTLVDSLIWCLFGRVPSKARPADTVINWHVGKDCQVKVTTMDGYVITRTRGVDGHDDLLVHDPKGEDVSLSTNPNCQKYLNKLFGLDYDIFMASVFFAQLGTPFLDLPDQKRKKALERMLHLTKFDVYAEVSKGKVDFLTIEQAKAKAELGQIDKEIIRLTQEVEKNNDELDTFERSREGRVEEAREEFAGVDGLFTERAKALDQKLETAKQHLSGIQTYDIGKLEKEWEKHAEWTSQIDARTEAVNIAIIKKTKCETEKSSLERHKDQIDPTAELDVLNEQLLTAQQELSGLDDEHDIESLTAAWTKSFEIDAVMNTAERQILDVRDEEFALKSELKTIERDVKKWEDKIGQVCSECRQPVGPEHIHRVNNDSTEKIAELQKTIQEKADEITRLNGIRDKIAKKQLEARPAINIATAIVANKSRASKLAEVTRLEKSIQNLTQTRDRLITEAATRKEKIATYTKEIEQFSKALVELKKTVETARQLAQNATPAVTLAEAQAVKSQYDAKNQEIATIEASIQSLDDEKKKAKEDIKADIKRITEETNPYQKMVESAMTILTESKERRAKSDKTVQLYDKLILHFDYIRSSHGDRKKMKAHTLSTMIPYLNQRLSYYLDSLSSQFSIELNSFLQIKSKTWAYEQTSGGERMRINLAMMFAIYDLHTTIYQQQCNLLVLDEVDGRLDPAGVNDFVNLLYKEFIDNKTDRTILVISHREEMRDAFPTKLLVKKDGDYSRIEEVA